MEEVNEELIKLKYPTRKFFEECYFLGFVITVKHSLF